MNRDPRTFGGVAPRETVTFTRSPLNAPETPVSPDSGERVALGSGSELTRSPSRGFAQDDPSRVPAETAATDPTAGITDESRVAYARYVDSLSEAERSEIETGPRSNDPGFVQGVLSAALSPQPSAQTIEGIEAFMTTNRRDYFRDEALQARYRKLLQEREERKA